MHPYIEPRLRRDFGGIISAYFTFLKANFAALLRAFLAYNGIFIGLFVLCSYLLVTGAISAYAVARNSYIDNSNLNDASLYVGFSIILFIIVFLVASLLNYGISSSYISIYEREKVNDLPRKKVWKRTVGVLGGLFLAALVAVGLYIVFFIVQIILAFIPLLGSLVTLVLGFAFNAWLSISIFAYVHNRDQNVFEAFGEGWNLLFSKFWRAIGVNFVLGLIIQIGLYSLSIAPSIVAGIYTYHSIESGAGIQDSVISQILLIVVLTLLCVLAMFAQMLSQTVNAFLYFNLHENQHNTYLQSRIMKIGEPIVDV